MKIMISIFGALLLLSATVSSSSGQSTNLKERHQFVLMPRDLALPLLVAQPDSPLEFVDTKLLVNVSSGLWIPSFQVRNRGTKPVCAFTVASAGSDEWDWKANPTNRCLMSGQVMSLSEESNNNDVVPLTDVLRDRLKLRGPVKGIIALLVVRAQYADGSEFRESGYETLDEYLQTVRGILSDPRFKHSKVSGKTKSMTAPPVGNH